jgi:ATP-binding protein involved in chromosome partitioning
MVFRISSLLHLVKGASGNPPFQVQRPAVAPSTHWIVSVNFALALAAQGWRVGLLDADVHGPSVPIMMNLSGTPGVTEDKLMVPLMNFGIKCMSVGFFVPDDSPTVWRGPMVVSALEQMLRKVSWGVLDFLVLDMPPGTGDIHLTVAQRVPVTGAVIVSTPQDIALIDARRGANMFHSVNIPILGVVENMSHYVCPSCGHTENIFGHRGAQQTAAEMELNFLGEVPLHASIREKSDSGEPIVFTDPESEQANHYKTIALRVMQQFEEHRHNEGSQIPSIVME